jgi:hypothetical protein
MRYSEKLKSFVGKRGSCEPVGSQVIFHLAKSHKAIPYADRDRDYIDTISEVGDDFVVINFASDNVGASNIVVPINLLVIYY